MTHTCPLFDLNFWKKYWVWTTNNELSLYRYYYQYNNINITSLNRTCFRYLKKKEIRDERERGCIENEREEGRGYFPQVYLFELCMEYRRELKTISFSFSFELGFIQWFFSISFTSKSRGEKGYEKQSNTLKRRRRRKSSERDSEQREKWKLSWVKLGVVPRAMINLTRSLVSRVWEHYEKKIRHRNSILFLGTLKSSNHEMHSLLLSLFLSPSLILCHQPHLSLTSMPVAADEGTIDRTWRSLRIRSVLLEVFVFRRRNHQKKNHLPSFSPKNFTMTFFLLVIFKIEL